MNHINHYALINTIKQSKNQEQKYVLCCNIITVYTLYHLYFRQIIFLYILNI